MFKRLLLILVFVSFSWSVPAFAEEDKALEGASTIGEVFGYISRYHLKQPDIDQLTRASIKGMLDQLNDPYTVYFSPGELEQFSDELNGDFEGIGAELEMKDQYPCIVRVLPGSPAEAAGLKNGDVIVAVDGKDVARKALYDVVTMLRGDKGTSVNLTVRRDGQPDRQVTITRNTVNLPTVHEKVLGNGIGYIAIESFGMETGAEFANALVELKESGIESLIIDLRNNGGGYVDAAAEIASYLLGKDKTVFVTEDREKHKDAFITELDPIINETPVVVLVNEQTASAAEILAGALQDYQVATLVGTHTYGKATVQDIIPLKNGGALKLTTAFYTTPRGRLIDGTGLQPDRYVTVPELQLHAARQLLHPTRQVIQFTGGNSKVIINDEIFHVPGGMLKEKGGAFVPLRFTLEALGYQVKWDSQSQGILVTGKGQSWMLPMNQQKSILNGATKQLHQPLREKNNTAYLSVADLLSLGVQATVLDNKVIISSM
ncbi:carboxyl-terminal processing protease [Desulforamulus putei DSM 12395]|uniref:Carboxyl-terminal processing protease n=1 Tax=Desulforamulus putei DSM 12395 TaxID=1121429 RepID=A0A1M4SIM7_9FIRM|nr:S41 family peptidase [Desulforamulus putei]SHE32065.1 carboxyl-terminal processing protease [Desulforamulus putei DSM 12395]